MSLAALRLPDAHAQRAPERLRGTVGGNAGTALDVDSDARKGLSVTDAAVGALGALGAEAAAAYDAQNTFAAAHDPDAQRLTRLVAGRERDACLDLNVKVDKTQEINALALPDGWVRVDSGLMDRVSDDDLRFVIGQEIGHVNHSHTKTRFRTAYRAQAARKTSQGSTTRPVVWRLPALAVWPSRWSMRSIHRPTRWHPIGAVWACCDAAVLSRRPQSRRWRSASKTSRTRACVQSP